MKMLFPMVCLGLALSASTVSAEPGDTRNSGQHSEQLYMGDHSSAEGGQGLVEASGCTDSEWAGVNEYMRNNYPGCYATSCTPLGGGWYEVGYQC